MEVKTVYFRQCLLRSPVFEGRAVGRDEDARAILAEPAVHSNRLLRRLCHCAEKFGNPLIGRIRPAVIGNQQKTSFSGFPPIFFILAFPAVFAAQIDDGGDAELLQRLPPAQFRLRSAIEMRVDFSGIVDALELNFFRDGRILFETRGISVCRAATYGGRMRKIVDAVQKRKRVIGNWMQRV